MKILVTGAKGFVGRNLCENLKAVRDGKNRTRPALQIEDVFEYDLDTPPAALDHFCAEADFVFNLAGVNRPKNNDEFMHIFSPSFLSNQDFGCHIFSNGYPGIFHIHDEIAVDFRYDCHVSANDEAKIFKKSSGLFFSANFSDCVTFAWICHR